MPGRKSLRGGGNRDKEKDRDSGSGGGGTRRSFATFWANASYKSFAKPHFRETEGGGSRSDLEDGEHGGGGGGVAAAAAGGHGRVSMHHSRYDSDSTPSLSHHNSQSDDSSREDQHHQPMHSVDLERGAQPLSPAAPRSLRIPDKRTPSGKFTAHQLLYVFGSHGVGAVVISGGINFAVAYGKPSRLFPLSCKSFTAMVRNMVSLCSTSRFRLYHAWIHLCGI